MAKLASCFAPMAKEATLAIGYAHPYLGACVAEQALTINCMPAPHGALYWPSGKPSCTVLAHESELPFGDVRFNRVLLVHAVEHTEHLRGLMKEVWRVLTPGGRVLVVVPNRLSFWARSSQSPFGYGRPFTRSQVKDLLEETQFTYLRAQAVLFMPPVDFKWVRKIAGMFEYIGRMFFPMFGGVWVVEAEKQIYATIKEPVAKRTYAPTPVGVPQTIRSLNRL